MFQIKTAPKDIPQFCFESRKCHWCPHKHTNCQHNTTAAAIMPKTVPFTFLCILDLCINVMRGAFRFAKIYSK